MCLSPSGRSLTIWSRRFTIMGLLCMLTDGGGILCGQEKVVGPQGRDTSRFPSFCFFGRCRVLGDGSGDRGQERSATVYFSLGVSCIFYPFVEAPTIWSRMVSPLTLTPHPSLEHTSGHQIHGPTRLEQPAWLPLSLPLGFICTNGHNFLSIIRPIRKK